MNKDLDSSCSSFHLYGYVYGYPACCIKEFYHHVKNKSYLSRPVRKLDGTGYIPCKTCNFKYTEDQLIENINKNRSSGLRKFHK